ncbi:hypothetical protein BON30_14055 [Cystobacter ferrugineus]|uniref:Uncharacterized protein n=1 Tax=Cystobacter ferrugineus TaxID=83449 RepID=A0A1L9BD77_9BACT|nr:hypothetical protein BON30_14055 [Cystobacter ferrugineus]
MAFWSARTRDSKASQEGRGAEEFLGGFTNALVDIARRELEGEIEAARLQRLRYGEKRGPETRDEVLAQP